MIIVLEKGFWKFLEAYGNNFPLLISFFDFFFLIPSH